MWHKNKTLQQYLQQSTTIWAHSFNRTRCWTSQEHSPRKALDAYVQLCGRWLRRFSFSILRSCILIWVRLSFIQTLHGSLYVNQPSSVNQEMEELGKKNKKQNVHDRKLSNHENDAFKLCSPATVNMWCTLRNTPWGEKENQESRSSCRRPTCPPATAASPPAEWLDANGSSVWWGPLVPHSEEEK